MKSVYIFYEDYKEHLNFDDNYFDLMPTEIKKVYLKNHEL